MQPDCYTANRFVREATEATFIPASENYINKIPKANSPFSHFSRPCSEFFLENRREQQIKFSFMPDLFEDFVDTQAYPSQSKKFLLDSLIDTNSL